jgi:hypothetical protein
MMTAPLASRAARPPGVRRMPPHEGSALCDRDTSGAPLIAIDAPDELCAALQYPVNPKVSALCGRSWAWIQR